MTELLFPEIADQRADPPVEPCAYPFFIVGYQSVRWGWKILEERFESASNRHIETLIKQMHAKGWTHVHVMRLPLGDHPWNEKGTS